MKEDLSQHTPAMRQYLEAKAQYPDCIVLFRMGDFYETFWDDAVKASEILGIALTKRGKSAGRDVVMAGIPWRQLDRYLAKLVAVGERVAICEQLTPPGKGLIERKVVRVVTPGTLTEEDALDDAERRWLAAVNRDDSGAWALAALDFASGRWRLQHGQGASALAEALESLGVAELLAPEDAAWAEGLAPNLQRLAPWSFAPDAAQEAVARLLHVKDWAALGLEGAPLVAGCVGAVLTYLEQTQRCSLAHLELPAFVEEAPKLVIDARTMRNLEAFADMRGDASMGMFAAIDRTLTPMGKRLLADWMRAPLVDLAAIRARHDAVASLVDDETTRADVRARLRGMRDWERMLGRIVMRRETPRDWLGLAEALKRLPELVALLAGRGGLFAEIVEGMRGLEALAEKLARALNPEPPASVRDPGMISKGFDAELDRLRALAEDKESWLAAFEARERERTGIPNLRVRHNKVFGYFIELTKAQAAKAPPDYVRRQTLTSVERFTTDELARFEAEVVRAQEEALAREQALVEALRREIENDARRIQQAAAAVAKLDVLAGLAEVALEARLVRPEVDEGETLEIIGGRHLVVERMQREFTPNDARMDFHHRRFMLLTGPNMGGKSTYMRQVAWCVWLAQMGSFVPAERARIPVMRRIFSRIGAGDELARGRSTFMVEMMETASILHALRPRSLVVIDEIGRGTSTWDGLAIAWAVAEALADAEGVLALFATHYHELVDFAAAHPAAFNASVAVREWQGKVIFLHRVVEGAADRSYGLAVAELAGMPRAVIARAREKLDELERQLELKAEAAGVQLGLFAEAERRRKEAELARWRELGRLLREADPDTLTPKQAHDLLYRLRALLPEDDAGGFPSAA